MATQTDEITEKSAEKPLSSAEELFRKIWRDIQAGRVYSIANLRNERI